VLAARTARSFLVVLLALLLVGGWTPSALAAPSSDLSVSIVDSADPAPVGEDLHYTVTVANAGPDDAAAVTVHDVVPDTTLSSFASATPSQGSGCTAPSGGAIDCDLGTVASGASATVDILLAPIAPGTLTDSATVPTGSDPDPSNNAVSEPTTSEGPTCTIIGTWANDVTSGTEQGDVMCGLGGNDTLNGKNGADVIIGGSGNDQLSGIGGTDLLFGGPGDDVLTGEKGDDFLSDDTGADQLFGGDGANTCLVGIGGTSDCPGRTKIDPNDTPGIFDLSTASVDRSAGFIVTLRTFAQWRTSGVWDRGFFYVLLDTRGTARPDYEIVIRSNGVRMKGILFKVGSNTRLRFLAVTLPDSHSVSLAVPLDKLTFGIGRPYVRWSAVSVWNDGPSCISVCFDFVPDAGMPPEPVP